ncbi:hypothetical protein GIB67_015355 [Kingdonia uniflora]|uniref:Uncharacterized protein n=1 Tax=Kingdonia uniflora TaxID=39325 RepID=A0A7J7KYX8_9MAGN|nr:hypothetical protein GIB67_015355 [Kingdonia uniflora]
MITEWSKMRHDMKERFIPMNYSEIVFGKLQSMKMGLSNIDDYTDQFYLLESLARLYETEQRVRYKNGLTEKLQEMIALQPIFFLSEIVQLAKQASEFQAVRHSPVLQFQHKQPHLQLFQWSLCCVLMFWVTVMDAGSPGTRNVIVRFGHRCGKLSWDQVLKYASLRKRYISLYASLLKSDVSRMVVDNNKEIEELDSGLDVEIILQWRMLAHKFVEQSAESEIYLAKQKTKKSWWSLGWSSQPVKDENEPWHFNDEDWEQLNRIIGYKEGDNGVLLETAQDKGDILLTSLVIHMKHNASRLVDGVCLAELSCEGLDCSVKMYSEAKVFDVKLESYRLSSPNGLLAESAATDDSLVGVFSYKPFDAKVDWSLVARASPCYMTYMKDPIDQIIDFFQSNAAVSQTVALETAAAVQMTIDGVKRTAQQQVTRALKDHSSFHAIELKLKAAIAALESEVTQSFEIPSSVAYLKAHIMATTLSHVSNRLLQANDQHSNLISFVVSEHSLTTNRARVAHRGTVTAHLDVIKE